MQKKWIIAIIITIIIIIGIIFFTIIIKSDKLKGLWEYDSNTKYEFNGRGKGKILVPIENIEFNYEKSRDTEYDFKVSKDSLELKDRNQPNVIIKLKKVKK